VSLPEASEAGFMISSHVQGSGRVERIPRSSSPAGEPSSSLLEFLLPGWMERLGVDRGQVASSLMRRLQAGCQRCSRTKDCARALDQEFDDAGWDRWYGYCSNSEILAALGAIQNCSRAAQHLKLKAISTD
jgi:hypothetical protein